MEQSEHTFLNRWDMTSDFPSTVGMRCRSCGFVNLRKFRGRWGSIPSGTEKSFISRLFGYPPTLLSAWIVASLNLLFEKLSWACLQKVTPKRQHDLGFRLKAFIAIKLLIVRSMFKRLLKNVRDRIQIRFNSEELDMIY